MEIRRISTRIVHFSVTFSPCQSVPAPLAETWPITTCTSWRRIRRIRPSSRRNASIGAARSNREQPDIDSNPLPGVELLKLFYRRSCKVFYDRAGKLAAAVLRDDHELLKLPGTVRCFRELMEFIEMERYYDYYRSPSIGYVC